MQLSSTLRSEKVKKRWKEQRHSYEEDLFKIYDTLLKEQLQKRCVELRLPISDEALNNLRDFLSEEAIDAMKEEINNDEI